MRQSKHAFYPHGYWKRVAHLVHMGEWRVSHGEAADLRVFVDHYNSHRPHRSLKLAPPDPPARKLSVEPSTADVERRDLLGGLVHEYSLAA